MSQNDAGLEGMDSGVAHAKFKAQIRGGYAGAMRGGIGRKILIHMGFATVAAGQMKTTKRKVLGGHNSTRQVRKKNEKEELTFTMRRGPDKKAMENL